MDGFQGSERDVIIISCVRGGGAGIGFLQHKERLNVALTRARYSLVVVGNMDTLGEASSKLWGELISNAKSRGVFSNLSNKRSPGELNELLTVSRLPLTDV